MAIVHHNTNHTTQSTQGNRGFDIRNQHWTELTEKRKLNPEWVEANCQSVTLQEASELLGYPAQSPGILIQGDGYQQQFKPDTPWSEEKKGGKQKKPKYRTPKNPPGQSFDIILPSHPTEKDYWWNLEKLKENSFFNDGVHWIVITEGGFKAIAGCSHQIATICLLGVEMGLTGAKDDPQGKRYLVPSLERIVKNFVAIKNKIKFGFIFCFDGDAVTNPSIIAAENKLSHQIRKFGIPVKSITGSWDVNEGKGMDDYISNNGIEAFREKLLNNYEYLSTDDEEKQKLPPANVTAFEIAENYRHTLAFESEYLLWRRYGAEYDGVWSVETTQSVRSIIHAHLESKLEVKHLNEKSGLIPLEDGVLDQKTFKLYPHAPSYRFTWRLPFKWADKDAGCKPIEEFLLKITGDSLIAEVLLCYLSAIVTRRADLQRYLELIGGGGTGKSTFMALAAKLAGSDNTVSSQLRLLESNQFETAKFYRKLLVLFPDSERWQGEVSVLKQLTGQDPIRYERKGVQQCRDFLYEGMVIISANEPPESSDRTSGLARRRLTIGLDNRIPEYEGRNLIKEFEPFLPGLLKRVLEISPERVTQLIKFTERHVAAIASKKWAQLCETNSIAAWLDQCLVISSDIKAYMGVDNPEKSGEWLYANFCQYQKESGHKGNFPLKRFSGNLRDLLKNQMKVAVIESRDRNGSYIEGIGLRCFHDPNWMKYPAPLTGKCDGLVMDNAGCVTAETIGSVECDGCDGFFEDSEFPEQPEISPKHEEALDEPQPQLHVENDEANFRNLGYTENPSHPSHPSLPMVSENTQPSHIHHQGINDDVIQSLLQQFETYPHLASNDIRAKENEATKIRQALLDATCKEELSTIKGKWGQRFVWVWKKLSETERAKLKDIARTEQLKIDLTVALPESTNTITPEFKVGDRVLVQTDIKSLVKYNSREGVVVEVEEVSAQCLVDFGNNDFMHIPFRGLLMT